MLSTEYRRDLAITMGIALLLSGVLAFIYRGNSWIGCFICRPGSHIAVSEPIGLYRHAPHPNVGKLFIDFILSQEGANLLRGQQRIPARLDVEPLTERLNPEKLRLYPLNISIEKLDPRGFRKFFGVGE